MVVATVTGATGFIGSALVRELLKHGYVVNVLWNNARISPELQPYVNEYHYDMFDEVCSDIVKGDYLFHFGWAGLSGQSRSNYQLQLKNAEAALNMYKLAEKAGYQKFIFPGSIMEDEFYQATTKIGECPTPAHIYGYSKLLAHYFLKRESSHSDVLYLNGKITNAYGPGENSPRLINSTIRKVLLGVTPEFTSANQNYDFMYIDDVVRAFRLIAEGGSSQVQYVISSGDAKPLRLYLNQLALELGTVFQYGGITTSGVNLPIEYYSNNLLKEQFDFIPEYSYVSGLRRTIEWIRNNQ